MTNESVPTDTIVPFSSSFTGLPVQVKPWALLPWGFTVVVVSGPFGGFGPAEAYEASARPATKSVRKSAMRFMWRGGLLRRVGLCPQEHRQRQGPASIPRTRERRSRSSAKRTWGGVWGSRVAAVREADLGRGSGGTGRFPQGPPLCYLISTVAPASSSWALTESASSCGT